MANFRGCNGHEATGGAGDRGGVEPPTIEGHNGGARVRGAEEGNGLPGKGRLTTSNKEVEDEGERERRAGSGRVSGGEEIDGATNGK